MAICLIVGSDKGIGRAICQQLRDRGEQVHAACLNDGVDLTDAGINVIPRIDVTSDEATSRLARVLRDGDIALDLVIHVAGVLGLDRLGEIDFDDVRRQIEINTIGPLRTVQAIRDRFANPAKLGIITSRVGSLADNGSGGMYAYRVSKCAANMVGVNLHHDLSPQGVAVQLLHPGMVATDLTKDIAGDFEYIQPSEAAAGLIRIMDELTPETAGRFRHANGEYLPW